MAAARSACSCGRVRLPERDRRRRRAPVRTRRVPPGLVAEPECPHTVGVRPPLAWSSTFARNRHGGSVTKRNDWCTDRVILCEGASGWWTVIMRWAGRLGRPASAGGAAVIAESSRGLGQSPSRGAATRATLQDTHVRRRLELSAGVDEPIRRTQVSLPQCRHLVSGS